MNTQIYIYSYIVIGMIDGIVTANALKKTKSDEVEHLEQARWYFSEGFLYFFTFICAVIFWPVFILKAAYRMIVPELLSEFEANKIKERLMQVRDKIDNPETKQQLQDIIDDLF